MESKHTPGPWKVGSLNGHAGFSINASNETLDVATVYLCQINSKWGSMADSAVRSENAEARANAKLIATAPKLLEACQRASDYFHDFVETDYEETQIAKLLREAISKTEGA